MDIPHTEPTEITAGDTVSWTRSLPDYLPVNGWVLSYILLNSSGKITIRADADGETHSVEVTASTTAGWAAGRYAWQAIVVSGSERHTVGTGVIEIRPNYSTQTTLETRSQARRILAGLMDAYENYVTANGGRGHVAEYQIAGRSMKFRTAEEILQQIEHWKREVAREDQAAALAAGRRPGRVFVRFG